jgi:hypothetical protein
MIHVKFVGFEYHEDLLYPEDVKIIGEGYSFWGWTPFDRFVIPIGGRIEIFFE